METESDVECGVKQRKSGFEDEKCTYIAVLAVQCDCTEMYYFEPFGYRTASLCMFLDILCQCDTGNDSGNADVVNNWMKVNMDMRIIEN